MDPSRDIEMRLEEAAVPGLMIRRVLETRLHADLVPGHRDLAAATGATIAPGRRADVQSPHRKSREGDTIAIGDVTVRAPETPGHMREAGPAAVLIVLVSHPSGSTAIQQPFGRGPLRHVRDRPPGFSRRAARRIPLRDVSPDRLLATYPCDAAARRQLRSARSAAAGGDREECPR